jgi:hypothetical protein
MGLNMPKLSYFNGAHGRKMMIIYMYCQNKLKYHGGIGANLI